MSKRKRFIIQDWAGNLIEPSKSWATFDDAWGFIHGELADRLGLTEDDFQEYYVEEKRATRETRFLHLNDHRNGIRQ